MAPFMTHLRSGNPLLMPELFQCILDCFPPYSPLDLESHQTLVSLALTCRAISEPTLDRLWRELNSLYQLIRCARQVPYPFPWGDRELTSEEEEAMSPPTPFDPNDMEEMVPPTPSEWDIIKKYSHRVQKLTINDGKLSFPFLKSIGSLSSPLFPNLQALSWRFTGSLVPGCIELIHPLLSPTLVELHADLTEEDGEELRSFLQNYPIQCRNLKTLTLRFRDSEALSEATTHKLSQAISTHEKLAHLRVSGTPIDAAALRKLAASATTESLSLTHYSPKPLPNPFFQPEHTPFRHVTDLDLTTSDLDLVTTFLTRDQMFRHFRIHVQEQPTAKALSTIFSMLASSSPNYSIRQVSLQVADPVTLQHFDPLSFQFTDLVRHDSAPPTEEELQIFRLTYESLLPLMPFSHLRELNIDWGRQVSLDDNELLNMARSWPSLQELSVECRCGVYSPQSTKYITFNGLLKLVLTCPNLKRITLPLDARKVPTDSDVDHDVLQVCSTNVESLRFPESPISDAGLVTAFLIKHFPAAWSTRGTFSFRGLSRSQNPSVSHYSSIWTEVRGQVSQFHHDRRLRRVS